MHSPLKGEPEIEVSAIQNDDDASLNYAMSLASGKAVKRLMAQTLKESIFLGALKRIGAAGSDIECEDLLMFHADFLASHLASLHEVNAYHSCFPWKIVLGLKESNLPSLMRQMKIEWQFVTTCIDPLPSISALYKIMSWTRAQPYRECMVAAESLGFDFKHLSPF